MDSGRGEFMCLPHNSGFKKELKLKKKEVYRILISGIKIVLKVFL
jgi:hypothetical protein